MSQLVIELKQQLSPERQRAVEEMVRSIAESVLVLNEQLVEQRRQQLVELFAADAKLSPFDVESAQMEAQARRMVAEGTEWLTTAQIGAMANLGQANPHATVAKWKQGRRLFAVRREGKDFFPRYALGDDYRPLPAMTEVLQVLSGYSSERLASWFESTSSFLGSARPRELIATQPDRVVAAARDTIEAEEFAG